LKGETSGNTQKLVRWFTDCDRDSLLFEVEQSSGACHTGYRSCFFQELDSTGDSLPISEQRLFDPDHIYNKSTHYPYLRLVRSSWIWPPKGISYPYTRNSLRTTKHRLLLSRRWITGFAHFSSSQPKVMITLEGTRF